MSKKIEILEPTKAYLRGFSNEEIANMAKELSYKNKSLIFQLMKLKKNKWFKQKNPSGWLAAVSSLESQLKTTLMFKDDRGIYIRAGSIPYLKNEYIVENHINYPKPKLMPWAKPLPFDPLVQTQPIQPALPPPPLAPKRWPIS